MSTKPRKCIKCGQKFADYKIYKDKVFCESCLDAFVNLTTNCSICGVRLKRKLEYIGQNFEKSDNKKTFCSKACHDKMKQDKLDMNELDEWLKSYHNTETLNSRIYMQISQYVKKNNFTYKGILLTLKYLVSEQRKELQVDNISIVSWYYDSAKENYLKKLEQQRKAQQLQEQNFQMFKFVETKSSVGRQIDKRKDEILITQIEFN